MNKEYDFINPSHYQNSSKEVWQMMVDIWGKEKFITHCEITAFKYLCRSGKKPNQPRIQEMKKAQWYLNKAIELMS